MKAKIYGSIQVYGWTSMKAFSHCFELSVEFAVASKTLAIYVLLANVSYSLRTYPDTCPTLKNV